MEFGFKLYFIDKIIYVSQRELKSETDGNTTIYRGTENGINILWKFEAYKSGFLVDLELSSDSALAIKRVDSLVFDAGIPQKSERIAFLGREMYANETRYPSELGEGREYGEICVGRFEDLSAKGIILAGVVPFENVYASVACKNDDGSFSFSAKTEFTDGTLMKKYLRAERVFFCENTSINEFFDYYRELIPKSSFDMPKLTGWNTWDYYLTEVTPEDIFENIDALKNMPFASKLDYIVIDDGWQKAWGDWTENEKFSCGLASVAERIREAGFIAGIWMAPLGIMKDSELFSKHPDWLCKNEKDEPLFDMGLYYLDPTNPEVEEFVLKAYRYQYDAGYRLFKMDYVSPLLQVKEFYDKTATPYSVLSDLVRKVKEATGEDARVLGCSLPPECGADIAPSMRIGVDVHNYFSHAVWIAQSLAWSWLYNNRITRIDPDFLIVRGRDTTDEELPWWIWWNKRNDFVAPPRAIQKNSDIHKRMWCHGEHFNAVEAETWANLVAVSGGNIFLSDRMSALNERGISIIEKAMALAGDEVRPIYLKEDSRLPSVWLGDKGLLLVNWEDVPMKLTFDGVSRRFNSEKPYLLDGDRLTVSLLPHESFAAIFG